MKRDFRFNFANSLMCECVICSWLRVLLSPVFRLCHPLLPLSWPWPLTLSLSLVPPSPSPGSTSSRPPQRRSPCRSNRLDAYVVFPPSPIPQHLALSLSLALRKHSVDDQRTVAFFFTPFLSFPLRSHILISHVPSLLPSSTSLSFCSALSPISRSLRPRIRPSSLIDYAPVLNRGF